VPLTAGVYSLGATADGSLWIGSIDLLLRWKDDKVSINRHAGGRINAILEDPAGGVWVARARIRDGQGPLCHTTGLRLTCLGKPDGILMPYAGTIVRDTAGALWLGGSAGLNLMILLPGDPSGAGGLAAYARACKLIDDLVVVPGAIGCLLTGLLFSALSPWGFFKHRWVAVKWALTVYCVLYGTFFLGPRVNAQAELALAGGLAPLGSAASLASRQELMAGGLLVLSVILFMTWLSVYRPWKSRRPEG
jgi:hypothetical protein